MTDASKDPQRSAEEAGKTPTQPPLAGGEADEVAAEAATDWSKKSIGVLAPEDSERSMQLRQHRAARERQEAITEAIKREGENATRKLQAEIDLEKKRSASELSVGEKAAAAAIERETKLTDVEVRERDSARLGKERERAFFMRFTAFGAVLTALTIFGVGSAEPTFYLGAGAGIATLGSGLTRLFFIGTADNRSEALRADDQKQAA